MESRLPKPRTLTMKKTASAPEVNLASVKMPEASSALMRMPEVSSVSMKMPEPAPTAPPTNLQATNGLKTIGKSKSTLNINAKSNENKPPTKPLLTRSHTTVSIARTAATKVAVKRLGTTSSAIENKRPNLRAGVKPAAATQRGVVGRVGAASATTGKAVGTAAAGVAKVAPKPSKWDLKGRLELATTELSSLREKHKKCSQLESIVDELREQESVATIKLEQLETANASLSEELQVAKKDFTEILDKHETLKTELKESQESYKEVAKALKKCEETCESQKKTLSEHAAKVLNLERNLDEEKQTNEELTDKVKELQSLVHQMDKDRRLLHNAIQELKGNIRVFCRVRPKIPKEAAKSQCTINFIDENTIEVGRADASDAAGRLRGAKQEFSFDKVFPPSASQAEVFEELSLLVQSALEGYNVCVFAYGQTGSGKTYTMEGGRSTETEGMIPRTVRHIFEEMKQFELLGWQYRIEASFLEIYNEHIVDLLDSQQKSHEIRMADSKGHDLYVSNLQVEEIHCPEELHLCLQTAQQNRAVAATFANERSSRSHSVARIRLIGTHAEKDEMSIGNLNLVDLAGSERLKGEEAARTTETKNINKSLANLGNVILALLKKQDHVPYRNSKLTHLLMPSLGGNSKTLMLLNVSPLDECYNETLNSLRFASNVNSCKTGNVKRSRQIMHNNA